MKLRGKIKRVFPDKGFGFISAKGQDDTWFKLYEDKEDVFTEGTEVEFDRVQQSDGRFNARSVTVIGASKVTPEKYYLPTDTDKALSSYFNTRVENLALRAEKYININDKLKIKSEKMFTNAEKKLLETINTERKSVFNKSGLTITAALCGRMVVGLGSASVFETGMIFHKPYGFPYIPGSSVKGALQSFLDREYKDKFNLEMLFGTEDKRGELIFFDAYPAKIDKLETDIMTPHFSDWYSKGTAPTDTGNPVPVCFYAVPADVEFIFHISGDFGDQHNAFRKAFLEMLEYAGLGAKTSVGYGWFREGKK